MLADGQPQSWPQADLSLFKKRTISQVAATATMARAAMVWISGGMGSV